VPLGVSQDLSLLLGLPWASLESTMTVTYHATRATLSFSCTLFRKSSYNTYEKHANPFFRQVRNAPPLCARADYTMSAHSGRPLFVTRHWAQYNRGMHNRADSSHPPSRIPTKVLMFVSNAFSPDRRVYMEATSLIRAGHEVGVVASASSPQHPLIQELDGIHISRVRVGVPAGRAFGTSFWGPIGRSVWQWRAYALASAMYRKAPFDVVHCHDLDTLAIGVALKRRFGVHLIYDAHEIYGSMAARTLPGWAANVFFWLERILVRYVDQIIVVSETVKSHLARWTDKSISIVMNCKPVQNVEYGPPDKRGPFTLLYIGGLNKGRALETLLDTVSQLPDVRCIVGGGGTPEYTEYISEKCQRASNMEFIGKVPFDQVIPMTQNADVVFCMFKPEDPNSKIGVPNKLFEAMICGRPIICTKGTYSGDLTEQEETGLTAECNTESLEETIVRLRDDISLRERLGRNALRAAMTRYNWQHEEAKLLEIYEGLRRVRDDRRG
jgi:glycosyltransferase involved in cell wall biosynthesis